MKISKWKIYILHYIALLLNVSIKIGVGGSNWGKPIKWKKD